MSLNELYTIWKKLKMGTIESSSMRNYIYSYEQHVSHSHLGDSRICDIRKSTIRAFYNNIIENRLMRAASLHTLHSALLQIFEVAVDDLIIPVNPADQASCVVIVGNVSGILGKNITYQLIDWIITLFLQGIVYGTEDLPHFGLAVNRRKLSGCIFQPSHPLKVAYLRLL